MRFTLLVAICCLAGASSVAALITAPGDEAGAAVVGSGPAMTIEGPSQVPVGQTTSLTVEASPPAPNTAGYQTEVIFPAGAEWLPRPSCAGEAMSTIAGDPPPFCFRDMGASDKARHFVLSSVFPPFSALDTPLVELIELDFRCNSPGNVTLVLTRVPDSAYGAAYFDTANNQIEVDSQPYDVDGDTTPEDVADVHSVECLSEPTWTPTIEPTDTPTSTPSASATPTATIDPGSLDTDGDGCADMREIGQDPLQGGMRNPEHFWDFFDVPAGIALLRDRAVSSIDIFAVLGRFNTAGDPSQDPLSQPPESGYHSAYDRGAVVGPDVWDLAEADGSIASTDIFGVLGQFNHSCVP